MSPPALRLVSSAKPAATPLARASSLAEALIAQGTVAAQDINEAQAFLSRRDARLGDALLAQGKAGHDDLTRAEANHAGGLIVDLDDAPPDGRLIDAYSAQRALRDGILPWRNIGAATVIVVASADHYHAREQELTALFGHTQIAFAPRPAIHAAILRQRRRSLAQAAEHRVSEAESCRTIWSGRKAWVAFALLIAAITATILFPVAALATATGWAILTLVLTQALRFAAMLAAVLPRFRKSALPKTGDMVFPRVSLLVPLFREREIAGHLMQRLERLDYPRELLDVCLIAEQNDAITQAAIEESGLPPWMRLIEVPTGLLQTKPRAMNYALDFTQGSIVGVYDAEDAPDPDQINRVVRHFGRVGPEVACLQGVLDFYNARQNWLSRCFTVDYATWFRMILPGLTRMGLVIPLGGTTLFFRRKALEQLGGWDAHNVTEDADLGIRLARRGYRTELLASVTDEEANCRVWPWVRQRSRWLKGYAITYAVHMRSPLRLLSDLGPWKFIGFQILFFGTLSQFVLAPVLWSFWMVPLGLTHPLQSYVPFDWMIILALFFVASEVVNIALGCFAVSGAKHRWLIPWVPTLHLYWPLGAIASYKALWEVARNPFFWDKTAHGVTPPPTLPDDAVAHQPVPVTAQEAPVTLRPV